MGSLALPRVDISFSNHILYVTLSVLRDSTRTPREWVNAYSNTTYGSHNLRSLLGRYLGAHPTGSVVTICISFGQSIIRYISFFRGLLFSSCCIGTNYYYCESHCCDSLSVRSVPLCILPQGAHIFSALGSAVGLLTESVVYEPYGYSAFSRYLEAVAVMVGRCY